MAVGEANNACINIQGVEPGPAGLEASTDAAPRAAPGPSTRQPPRLPTEPPDVDGDGWQTPSVTAPRSRLLHSRHFACTDQRLPYSSNDGKPDGPATTTCPKAASHPQPDTTTPPQQQISRTRGNRMLLLSKIQDTQVATA